MHKTHKQLAEVQDFALHDYRVSPHHIAQIQRRNHANHIKWHPFNKRLKLGFLLTPARPEQIPAAEPEWMPPKHTHQSTIGEFVREQRLELLQVLGEKMLASA